MQKRSITFYPIQGINNVHLTNDYGSVLVTGWSISDSIRLTVTKSIKAANRSTAEAHFADVKVKVNTGNDTVMLSVAAPLNNDRLEYSCSISIEIPFNTFCEIFRSKGDIFVDQLDSSLKVHNAKEGVDVGNHNGSCNINSTKGIYR